MADFRIKTYYIQSEKIKSNQITIIYLSDLHGMIYGENNAKLFHKIKAREPDLILAGGDIITGSHHDTIYPAEELLTKLRNIAPVYYGLGNHEQYLFGDFGRTEESLQGRAYREYLIENDMILDNDVKTIKIDQDTISIGGLSLDKNHYYKPFPSSLTKGHIREKISLWNEEEAFTILLAHNPYFGDVYFSTGSDLILSGHYHGGVVRFGENRGLISTHFHLFPKYCCGKFSKREQNMIVSGGLGEHTVKVRINNPREVIEIQLMPPSDNP